MVAVWNATATIPIAAVTVNGHVQAPFHAQYAGVSAVCLHQIQWFKIIAIRTQAKETCQHGHRVLIRCFTFYKNITLTEFA
jgi:hypothetical protein